MLLLDSTCVFSSLQTNSNGKKRSKQKKTSSSAKKSKVEEKPPSPAPVENATPTNTRNKKPKKSKTEKEAKNKDKVCYIWIAQLFEKIKCVNVIETNCTLISLYIVICDFSVVYSVYAASISLLYVTEPSKQVN